MYLPQHPVHYVFGMPSHAPLVMKAWMNEPLAYKAKLLAWYISFFFLIGTVADSFRAGLDLVGVVIFTTLIISMPAAVCDPDDKDLIPSISDAFFNGILSFHGFIILYLSLHAFVNLVAVYFGIWSLQLSNMMLSLSFGLMVGFSLQQAVSANKNIPWMLVPIFSLIAASFVFYFIGQNIPTLEEMMAH